MNNDAVEEVAEVIMDATTAYPREDVVVGLINVLDEIVAELDDPDTVRERLIHELVNRWL